MPEDARSRNEDPSPSLSLEEAIARDRSIIADPAAAPGVREAARMHLRQLGVAEEVDDAG